MHSSDAAAQQPMVEADLYASDFYVWVYTQAALLRQGHWNQLDLPNLIEEIESLGRQQRQELRNRLSILIGHLLKWQYQPKQRNRSWLATLRIQRLDITDLLNDSPSLKPYLSQAVASAYLRGKQLAVRETDLPERTFPEHCPYSIIELLDKDFYPGDPDAIQRD
ncbi:MAG: DUF29 domain-containing protein [Cyanobacteria bacterium P01_H01_bin.119]